MTLRTAGGLIVACGVGLMIYGLLFMPGLFDGGLRAVDLASPVFFLAGIIVVGLGIMIVRRSSSED